MNKSAISYSCRMIKSLKKYNNITMDTNNMIIKYTLHFLHVLFHIHIDLGSVYVHQFHKMMQI